MMRGVMKIRVSLKPFRLSWLRNIAPKPGMLITWNNMDRRGRPNAHTRHAALPVRTGQKYVITQWYRQGEWKRNPA